jgi:hypothetical protein
MPHAQNFIQEHTAVAEDFEDQRCLECHVKRDCDACHVMHTHPGSTRGTIGPFGGLTP